MAVTAGQEYGLFIGGEVVEPASGEIRDLAEPATGELLARAAMAGEADVDRALSIDTLDLYLETKGVLFSTSPRPFNPFGLEA